MRSWPAYEGLGGLSRTAQQISRANARGKRRPAAERPSPWCDNETVQRTGLALSKV